MLQVVTEKDLAEGIFDDPRFIRVALMRKREVILTVRSESDARNQISALGSRVIGHEWVRAHICSVCSCVGPWTDAWTWYGSYAQIDDGKPIVKTCSEKCAEAAKAQGIVPRNAPQLDDD